MEAILNQLGQLREAALYFVVGLVALIIGRKILDLVTPHSMSQEIGEKNNVAAGVTAGGFYVGLAIITHAAIAGVTLDSLWRDVLNSVIYFVFGLVALAVGRKVLDLITPFSINKEIVEDQNVAAGAVEASFYVAIAIIIHATVS